ncbi:hypothetical protein MTO96_051639 [Rhipicephalus appendiculatus]
MPDSNRSTMAGGHKLPFCFCYSSQRAELEALPRKWIQSCVHHGLLCRCSSFGQEPEGSGFNHRIPAHPA